MEISPSRPARFTFAAPPRTQPGRITLERANDLAAASSNQYIGIDGNDILADKAYVMRLYSPPVSSGKQIETDRRVRVYGSVALVTGNTRLKQIGMLNSNTATREGSDELVSATRTTRIRANLDDRWRVVSWQATVIPRESREPRKP